LEEEKQGLEFETEENPFVKRFESFFKSQYMADIEKLVEGYPEKRSLNVDFKEIEHYDFELADELLVNPDYLLEAANTALKGMDIPSLDIEDFSPFVRIHNLPPENQPVLRDISAEHLNKLISVEGVIRQITEVKPKLRTATWECKRCDNTYKIIQGNDQIRKPSICECKHRDFRLVGEQSAFIDSQKISVQEPLEILKGSEQPTNLDIHVSEDLVNVVSPGDRTRIVGILRLYAAKESKLVYERYLEAIHVEETAKEFEEVEVTKEEEEEIRKLAEDPEIYEKLVKSIAPTIYGHESVKEAIVLQLFGGVNKSFPGANNIRGNIHILLVGEPGMAKSQLLQAVDNIAPKSIYTAGKGTTGAGLSATAVKDDFGEGGWTLKAGALVLASGGLCMVDELDKMEQEDRSTLHESMEQQKTSIAKAGIVTRFKTETSILAAANPKHARFDPYTNFIEQINLPITLISRFDLFFMIRDVLDRKKDADISKHILSTHQAGERLMQARMEKQKLKAKEAKQIEELVKPAIEGELLKKYVSFARQKIYPLLSDDGVQDLTDFYVNLRDQGREEGSYAATHRQLEALVRLSEASARVRLSDIVEKEDTERAMRIFRTSLADLVTDPETGKVDIDIITVGQTHTQRDQMKKVLNIIKSKAAEYDIVNLQEVIEEGKTLGMDEERIRDLVRDLKKSGDIYEPKHGQLKPTDNR